VYRGWRFGILWILTPENYLNGVDCQAIVCGDVGLLTNREQFAAWENNGTERIKPFTVRFEDIVHSVANSRAGMTAYAR
jgi:hypothetical protein